MLKRQIRHRNGFKAMSVASNVRLIKPAPRQPATDVERLAVSRLRYMGKTSLNSLVTAVARDLYVKELTNCASILDIGVFGLALFPTALL